MSSMPLPSMSSNAVSRNGAGEVASPLCPPPPPLPVLSMRFVRHSRSCRWFSNHCRSNWSLFSQDVQRICLSSVVFQHVAHVVCVKCWLLGCVLGVFGLVASTLCLQPLGDLSSIVCVSD